MSGWWTVRPPPWATEETSDILGAQQVLFLKPAVAPVDSELKSSLDPIQEVSRPWEDGIPEILSDLFRADSRRKEPMPYLLGRSKTDVRLHETLFKGP